MIKGILEEGEEDMKEAKDPDVLDAGMIADAQAVEHYEIARYGTMIAWAKQLGMNDASGLSNRRLSRNTTPTRPSPKIAEVEPESRGRRRIHRDRASKFYAGRRGLFARAVSLFAP